MRAISKIQGMPAAFLLLLMLLLVPSGASAQSLEASVDRATIAVDESVNLTVIADGITGQPDLSPLAKDFQVLQTSQRREVKIIEGQMSDLQSWVIEIIPKREGDLVIPALTLAGVSSNPVAVKVNKANEVARKNLGTVFLEVNIDNPSPYVQGQVIYTVRFFSSVRIVDGELSEPVAEKLSIQRLGDDTGFFQQRNNRRYRVLERRYAVFPRESGTIEIPPVELRVSIPDSNDSTGSFFGKVKRLTRRGPVITLEVQPKPQAPADVDAGAWWLAARSVSLDASWEGVAPGAQPEFRVGEPLTRAIVLRADGATGEQLPELPVPKVNGLRIYADKPEVVDQPGNNTLVARRVDKWAIIAEKAGEMTLPAIELTWFDTVAETYRVSRVAPLTVNVLPAAGTVRDLQQAGAGGAAATGSSAEAGISADDGSDKPSADAIAQSNADAQVITADSGNVVEVGHAGSQRLTFWKTLALAALVAWALTALLALAFWWRARHHAAAKTPDARGLDKSRASSSRTALKQIDKAVKAGTPAVGIGNAVLSWAATRWPQKPPRSLQELSQRYPESAAELRGHLRQLDRESYGSVPANESGARQDAYHGLAGLLGGTEPLPGSGPGPGQVRRDQASSSAGVAQPLGTPRLTQQNTASGALPEL